jgi:hypothetical protein
MVPLLAKQNLLIKFQLPLVSHSENIGGFAATKEQGFFLIQVTGSLASEGFPE